MFELEEQIITIRGISKIGDVEAAAFDAVINYTDPANMNVSGYVTNAEVYKSNILQCRKDEDEFREFVQKMQDEMLAAR